MHFCKPLPQVALVFFYFDFNDTKKRSFGSLIRSLITQICSKCETIPEVLLELYRSHINTSQGIDDDVLVEAFRELVRTFQGVYIVLDALDESSECREILRFIENVQDWSLSQIHFLITSRQWSEIEDSFEHIIPDRICLQDSQTNKDVIIYIEETIANDKVMTKWPADIRQQVRDKLVAEQQGM
jgi:hypothetical protein